MSKNSVTVNLAANQREWLKLQPRDFNFSELVRQLLDVYIETGDNNNECNQSQE